MDGQADYDRERERLARIVSEVTRQLLEADEQNARRHESIVGVRHEMNSHLEQMFENVWEADDFERLVALNQASQPLYIREKVHEMGLSRAEMLTRMRETPYFARIDMRFDDGGDTESIYIGRGMLKDERTHEMFIHDWRSPIAGVFYRFGVGRAEYDAPGGRITGDVTLKRQYEIRRGQLVFYFDADVEIQDAYLRQLLSKNASQQMRAIVETIQRDQDAAIRDTQHDLLMVQGAAGSGKTSIALHRAAYLMYDGLSSHLAARNILILSPNSLFERYIESVLPELGENAVATYTYERLIGKLIGGYPVKARTARFDEMCAADADRRALMRKVIAFKGSEAFAEIVDRFIEGLPRDDIEFQDVCYGGETIASREVLKMRILRPEPLPLGMRLRRMEMSLRDGIAKRRPGRMLHLVKQSRHCAAMAGEIESVARAYSLMESEAVLRRIRGFTRLSLFGLYARLFGDDRRFAQLAEGICLPAEIAEILAYTRAAIREGELPAEDAAAMAYMKIRLYGADDKGEIRQLVIDEAQDYGALDYRLFAALHPRARMTVLGDIQQTLDRRPNRGLYDEIIRQTGRRGAALIELTKSFRCTKEILRFSVGLLDGNPGIESFARSGDAPEIHMARSAEEMDARIAGEVNLCREKGFASIALIAKTAAAARAYEARLHDLNLRLIDENAETKGAFVIPLSLIKGLEFDAALVLDADDNNYGDPEDANLLYVACTRALHRLSLFASGAVSHHVLAAGKGVNA